MNVVDLFAGCGGLSLGFQNAGFKICAAYEFWDVAADCYEKNFPHPVFRIDLSDVDNAIKIIQPFNPDVIIGGPPCQDFSHAGKRVEAKRAALTECYAEIVSRIRPRYFVMENVDRAANSMAFADAREIFKQAGYGITEITLDASLCGVPQKRKRFFCVGELEAPDDKARKYLEENISDKETTLREYFGDVLGFEFYYRHPRNYNRRAIFSIDEPAPTIRGVNRPIPKGYPGHPNDACQLNNSIRALTTDERALIQTFPADFVWTGNKTEREQMIGNAVPVKLAEFVGRALQKMISENCQTLKIDKEFASWLVSYCGYSERVAKDTLSRVKRANKIHQIDQQTDSLYLYELQQIPDFYNLSNSVRSQIKRAASLYFKYLTTVDTHREGRSIASLL